MKTIKLKIEIDFKSSYEEKLEKTLIDLVSKISSSIKK